MGYYNKILRGEISSMNRSEVAALRAEVADLKVIAEKCLDPEFMKFMTESVIVVETIKKLKKAQSDLLAMKPLEDAAKAIQAEHAVAERQNARASHSEGLPQGPCKCPICDALRAAQSQPADGKEGA